jgi:alkylmercury lyase
MADHTPDLVDRLASSEETGLDPALLVPLLKLLANGEPVAVDELAAATGRTVEEIRKGLAAVPDTEYDADGRIVGQGLTLRATSHRFSVEGRELYTWCALDTLIFPSLLDRTASIESTSPASGEPIRVSVDPSRVISVEPATAVVSLVNPEDMTSVRSSFCNQVYYFTSADDAQPWLEDHRGATLLPVADAYRLGVALTTSVVEQLQTDMVIGTAESRGTGCCR